MFQWKVAMRLVGGDHRGVVTSSGHVGGTQRWGEEGEREQRFLVLNVKFQMREFGKSA